jgi:hypothetical protein
MYIITLIFVFPLFFFLYLVPLFFFLYLVAFSLLLYRFDSECGILILPKLTSLDPRHHPVPTCCTEEAGPSEMPGVGFELATPKLKPAAATVDRALCINTAQVSQIVQFAKIFMAQ